MFSSSNKTTVPAVSHLPWVHMASESVVSVAWLPDNCRLAVLDAAGKLALLDTGTGNTVWEVEAHVGGGFAVSVAATGQGVMVATGGQDGCVRLWSAAEGAAVKELRAPTQWVELVTWSPDGKHLAAAAGRHLTIYDATACQVQQQEAKSTISALQWRPDSKGFAFASYGKVELHRLGESKPYEILDWKTSLIAMAWSPNARFVAASTQEETVQFWRVPTKGVAPLQMSGYQAKVRSLGWNCESRFLATSGGDVITVWDVSGKGPAGSQPIQLEGHSGKVQKLRFQNHGQMLASGCQKGSVCFWLPSKSEEMIKATEGEGTVLALEWSPGDNLLAIGRKTGGVSVMQVHRGS